MGTSPLALCNLKCTHFQIISLFESLNAPLHTTEKGEPNVSSNAPLVVFLTLVQLESILISTCLANLVILGSLFLY